MDEPKAADAAALDASILPTMAAAEAALKELDAVVKPEPKIDALNINTYAGPPPRTSGRRRKPSVLVHQVSVDEDDGGLYVQPAPRPVYQGGVRLSALRVKQLVDSDQATLDRDEICEAMDVDGKVSQTDYGRCGGMLSGRLGPNKFIVDYAKGLRSKCKRHRCKHAFRDGELRVGKIPPRARKDVPARRVHWYHPACIFKSFERASKKTKTIDTIEEIEGFEELHKADQRDLAKRVDEWAARKAESLAMYKPKKKKARRESPSAVALALAVAEAAAAPKKLRMDPGGSEFVTPPSSPKPKVRTVTPCDGPSSDEDASLDGSAYSMFLPEPVISVEESMEMPLMEMPLDSLAYVDANDTLDFGALLPSIFDEVEG